MPVIDHDSSEQVKRASDAPYGCTNRDAKAGYYTNSRWYNADGTFSTNQQFVKHTMSTECRYSDSLTDPRCQTCAHRGTGEAYSEQIRSQGN